MPQTDIQAILEERGLQRVARELAACAKPCIRLRACGRKEGPVTRLGGRPNLPGELKWPQPEGQTLAFVAQVDLAALPAVPDIGLPESGALYFFWEGFDEGIWAVGYSARSLTEFPPREFPEDLELRLPIVELGSPVVEPTMPDRADQMLWKLGLSEEEIDVYDEFKREWGEERYGATGIHCLGGYPDLIQDSDPKVEAHLAANGLDSIPEDEADATLDWRLLFQVDSELDADISWGDAGKLYFMIHKDDLRKRQFSETWLVMQSS